MELAGEVLEELGVERDRVVTVFNKADLLNGADGGDAAPALWVSALTGEGVDELRNELRQRLRSAA